MKVLLAGEIDAAWRRELSAAMPEATWLDAGEADAALVANPPPGALAGQPRLRLIQSLWAGVDRLLADPTLPAGVPIARMVDPAMSAAMAETALWATLSLHRGFFAYAQAQREAVWRVHAQRRADEVGVLVLGQGEMGRAAAARIAQQGYPVRGWRRSRPARRHAAAGAAGRRGDRDQPAAAHRRDARPARRRLLRAHGAGVGDRQPRPRRAPGRGRPARRARPRPPAPCGARRLPDRTAARGARLLAPPVGHRPAARRGADRPAQRERGGGGQPARRARRPAAAHCVDRARGY